MGDMANGFIDGLFDGLLRAKTKKTSKPRLTDAGWHDNAVVPYQMIYGGMIIKQIKMKT